MQILSLNIFGFVEGHHDSSLKKTVHCWTHPLMLEGIGLSVSWTEDTLEWSLGVCRASPILFWDGLKKKGHRLLIQTNEQFKCKLNCLHSGCYVTAMSCTLSMSLAAGDCKVFKRTYPQQDVHRLSCSGMMVSAVACQNTGASAVLGRGRIHFFSDQYVTGWLTVFK